MKKFTTGSWSKVALVLFLAVIFSAGCSASTTKKVMVAAFDGVSGASEQDQQKSLSEALQAGGDEASQAVKDWSVSFGKSLTEVGDKKRAIRTALFKDVSKKTLPDKLPPPEFVEGDPWGNDAHRVLEGSQDPADYSIWWRVNKNPGGLMNQNNEPLCEGWITLGAVGVYRFWSFSDHCAQAIILLPMLRNHTLNTLTPEEQAKVVWLLATVVARETKGTPPPTLDALLKLAK